MKLNEIRLNERKWNGTKLNGMERIGMERSDEAVKTMCNEMNFMKWNRMDQEEQNERE